MILLSTIVILIFNPDTSILKFTYLSMGLRGAVYFVPVMLVIFNKNLVKLDNVKRIIARDYFLIYEESETNLTILRIWDTRQDPNKLDYKVD